MGGRDHHIMGLLDNIPKTADLIAAHHRASLGHDDVAQPAPVAAVPAAPVPAEATPDPEGACPEMMSPVNGRDDFSPHQTLGWENEHVTSYGRTNSPTEALRGSERKKANQLEELDPWASYTKGMFLGEGKFAEVYLVTDKNTGVEYACKILCKAGQPSAASQLTREVEVMLNAAHQFLCTVHRVFRFKGVLHFVMDIMKPSVQGESADLLTWIMHHDGLPTEREVATIIHRVALAVQYLNAPPLSCMHRDLKPGNVLVSDNGIDNLKVADFGMARMDVTVQPQRGLRRAMTAKAGTPEYMAAECISGDYGSNPFKVDVFSLGCIAYVSLKQQFPFGNDQYECFRRVAADDWDHCETNDWTDWDVVSSGCKNAVRKMLERDQDARYSIEEVLADPWVRAMANPV